MIVIKRDGREVDFDKSKIFNAVYKAVVEVDKIIPQKDKETLASDIANKLQKKYNKLNRAITVEDIQLNTLKNGAFRSIILINVI